MAVNLDQLKTEMGAYARTNSKEIRTMVYQKSVSAGYMKTVTSVKGKFPAMHSVTGRLIQGFTTTWNSLGETKFKVNELTNHRQKVNYELIPDDVENSWINHLFESGKKPAEQSISKYIFEQEIPPKLLADREYLLCRGSYNGGALGTFGNSMNGIATRITEGIADGAASPMYQVGITSPTASNIVAQIETFELNLPEQAKPFLTKIYMSQAWVEKYRLDMRNKFGTNTDYAKADGMLSPVGLREIVGLPGLNGTNIIFSTPDTNFLRLVDLDNDPIVRDIQVQDYKVKIFMDWWESPAFWTNQLVFVAVPGGDTVGLDSDNLLYYGVDKVVTP